MNQSMRVLWVRKIDLDQAAARDNILTTLEDLTRFEIEPELLTTYALHPHGHGRSYPVVQFSLPRRPILRSLVFGLKATWRIWQQVLAGRVDRIVLDKHTFALAFPFDLIGRLGLGRVRVAVDFRDNLRERPGFSLRTLLARLANAIGPLYASWMASGLSGTTQEALAPAGRFPWATRHQLVYGSGVDQTLFDPERSYADPLPGIPADRLILFYHGSVQERRGLEAVLSALALLPASSRPQFVVLGNGPLAAQLPGQARLLGVADWLTCLSEVPQQTLPAYLARATASILAYPDDPMWQMSSPLKLVESLAMGRLVIVRNFPVFAPLVADLPGVLLLADNQPETIAAALSSLPDLARRFPPPISSHRLRILQSHTVTSISRSIQAWLVDLATQESES